MTTPKAPPDAVRGIVEKIEKLPDASMEISILNAYPLGIFTADLKTLAAAHAENERQLRIAREALQEIKETIEHAVRHANGSYGFSQYPRACGSVMALTESALAAMEEEDD